MNPPLQSLITESLTVNKLLDMTIANPNYVEPIIGIHVSLVNNYPTCLKDNILP